MHSKDGDETIFILFISGERISDLQVGHETYTSLKYINNYL